MHSEDLALALEQSDQLYDQQQISHAYDQLATQITYDLCGELPLVLCVMNGGLVLTAALLQRMDFPLELDYAHVTRYKGSTKGGEIDAIHLPVEKISGRAVLIVDDILDEGNTLQYLRNACIAHGAKSVASAVLVIKEHDRRISTVSAEYIGLTVPDRYVVGCGMDYHEYFRNLNTIHALNLPE